MNLDVEPVLQRGDFDCGAACLEMLLRFHGAAVPRDLRRLCSPHDGLQPDAIKAVLQRQWGHYTSARLTPGILKGFLLDGKPVLCPLWEPGWSASHWVVVTGWTPRKVRYACPIEGPRLMAHDRWLAAWRDETPAAPFACWGVTSWPA